MQLAISNSVKVMHVMCYSPGLGLFIDSEAEITSHMLDSASRQSVTNLLYCHVAEAQKVMASVKVLIFLWRKK